MFLLFLVAVFNKYQLNSVWGFLTAQHFLNNATQTQKQAQNMLNLTFPSSCKKKKWSQLKFIVFVYLRCQILKRCAVHARQSRLSGLEKWQVYIITCLKQ